MAFFDKSIEHAKESLAEVSREAIDHAGERLRRLANQIFVAHDAGGFAQRRIDDDLPDPAGALAVRAHAAQNRSHPGPQLGVMEGLH